MPYARTDVRTALHEAREAGKPVDGLIVGDRETALQLERWGFLPVNREATEKRIADWYVANGLAVRVDDTPDRVPDTPHDTRGDTPGDTPGRTAAAVASVIPVVSSASSTMAALVAAEAAIEAARLALAAARTIGGSAA